MDGINALQLRDNARAELMQIKDIETGFEYLSKVKAIEVWAKAEKKDSELQNLIAEQKIRTQRILGQLIKDGQDAGEIAKQDDGRPISVPSCNTYRTLTDIGISRRESSTFKQIASIPDDVFESTIAEKKEAVTKAVSELTTAGMLKVAKEIKKEEKKEEKIKQFEQASLEYQDENVKIFFEDFREGAKTIENNSVDAIITDPPYPIEYIDLWADMFAIADRILKPSAFLVTYANHQNLDRIFQLPNPLKYYWIFKLDFTSKPIAMGRNLIATWKPVLIFQKLPFKKIEETLEDNIKESKPFNYDERDMHKSNWGQSLGKFEWIIDKFTKPGDLIVEPFAGTGTTLVASKNMKRRCIGYEIDKTNYESIIKGRIERGE
jgi:site-specific DNA-methyltransferase (adenine-specific)